MGKSYEGLSLVPLGFRLEGRVLNGSYTNQAIKVQTVTVDDFDNGFDSTIAPDGFQDISFE